MNTGEKFVAFFAVVLYTLAWVNVGMLCERRAVAKEERERINVQERRK